MLCPIGYRKDSRVRAAYHPAIADGAGANGTNPGGLEQFVSAGQSRPFFL